jgi:hypothetical protein
MSSSKKPSTSVVVGRRLRRYLGALLAVGFGAAWWSFVPHASVEASVPVAAASPTKPTKPGARVAPPTNITPPARPEIEPATPTRVAILPPRRIPRRPVKPPPVIEPVIEPVIAPVTEPPPVIAVVITPPPDIDLPEPPPATPLPKNWPNIVTRSS